MLTGSWVNYISLCTVISQGGCISRARQTYVPPLNKHRWGPQVNKSDQVSGLGHQMSLPGEARPGGEGESLYSGFPCPGREGGPWMVRSNASCVIVPNGHTPLKTLPSRNFVVIYCFRRVLDLDLLYFYIHAIWFVSDTLFEFFRLQGMRA